MIIEYRSGSLSPTTSSASKIGAVIAVSTFLGCSRGEDNNSAETGKNETSEWPSGEGPPVPPGNGEPNTQDDPSNSDSSPNDGSQEATSGEKSPPTKDNSDSDAHESDTMGSGLDTNEDDSGDMPADEYNKVEWYDIWQWDPEEDSTAMRSHLDGSRLLTMVNFNESDARIALRIFDKDTGKVSKSMDIDGWDQDTSSLRREGCFHNNTLYYQDGRWTSLMRLDLTTEKVSQFSETSSDDTAGLICRKEDQVFGGYWTYQEFSIGEGEDGPAAFVIREFPTGSGKGWNEYARPFFFQDAIVTSQKHPRAFSFSGSQIWEYKIPTEDISDISVRSINGRGDRIALVGTEERAGDDRSFFILLEIEDNTPKVLFDLRDERAPENPHGTRLNLMSDGDVLMTEYNDGQLILSRVNPNGEFEWTAPIEADQYESLYIDYGTASDHHPGLADTHLDSDDNLFVFAECQYEGEPSVVLTMKVRPGPL